VANQKALNRILIIDDHDVVREGVKGLFGAGTTEFGEAPTGAAAIDRIRERDWDIAVLDISLAGRSGLDVLKEIKQLRPKLPVLVLSMHAEEQYAMRAFKAGRAFRKIMNISFAHAIYSCADSRKSEASPLWTKPLDTRRSGTGKRFRKFQTASGPRSSKRVSP